MKDYKLETFSNKVGKNQSKTTGLKTKGFGYQILGFGSGGGAPTYDIEFLVVAGGGCGGNSNFGFISGGGWWSRWIQNIYSTSICRTNSYSNSW